MTLLSSYFFFLFQATEPEPSTSTGRKGKKVDASKLKKSLLDTSSDESEEFLPSTSKTRQRLTRTCKQKKIPVVQSSSEEDSDTSHVTSKNPAKTRRVLSSDSSNEEYLPPFARTERKLQKMDNISRGRGDYFMDHVEDHDLEAIRVPQVDHGESIENEDFNILQTTSPNPSDDEGDEIPDIDTSSDDVSFKLIFFKCLFNQANDLFHFM